MQTEGNASHFSDVNPNHFDQSLTKTFTEMDVSEFDKNHIRKIQDDNTNTEFGEKDRMSYTYNTLENDVSKKDQRDYREERNRREDG